MESDWREVRLGDVVQMKSGGTPRKSESSYWGGSIPWLSAKDMKSFLVHDTEDHVTELGAANGTRRMPAGATFLLVRGMTLLNDIPIVVGKKPMTFNQDVKGLLPKSGVVGAYVPYLLLGMKSALRDLVDLAGHGTGRLNTDRLQDLPCLLPNDDEQCRIVALLSALDERIDHNRVLAANLEAIARALFKSWFVDFDPVRAKAAGEAPPGLTPDLVALFPDRLDNGELGEIPQGWTRRTIGDLADIVGGSTPSTKDDVYWADGQHHWATPKDLAGLSSPVLLSTERKVTDAGLKQISSGLLPPGTVLLSSRAPIGYLAIATTPVAINQGFIAMKPKQGVSNLYLLYWSETSQDAIVANANGSTFLEISKKNFRPIPAVDPGRNLMSAFSNVVKPMFDRVICAEQEIATLTGLRDFLLPRLISGKLRIEDAEQALEAA